MPHARHKWSKGADNWDKARNNNGFAAVFGVESFGFFQVALFEDFGVGVGKQPFAKVFADGKIHRIAQNGGQ